ncbi:MAG TPA: hypothetical protein PK655_03610 [archaeon]|jgi:tRNA A37 threonylcarbamoyladenosine modification protein TsaB|nr:hypothetical protein [archaeon]HPV66507.1 hypothetical protein [archaeon]
MSGIEIIKNQSKHNYVYKHNYVINMVSVTLAVSKEIKEKMKKYDEINWSSFIRKAIADKVKKLEAIDQLLEKESEISDWAVNLQKKSRKDRAEQLKKEGLIS